MKRDFQHVGFYNLNPLLRARLYACPELKDDILANSDIESVWDCPRCHGYIIQSMKPKECNLCGRKAA